MVHEPAQPRRRQAQPARGPRRRSAGSCRTSTACNITGSRAPPNRTVCGLTEHGACRSFRLLTPHRRSSQRHELSAHRQNLERMRVTERSAVSRRSSSSRPTTPPRMTAASPYVVPLATAAQRRRARVRGPAEAPPMRFSTPDHAIGTEDSGQVATLHHLAEDRLFPRRKRRRGSSTNEPVGRRRRRRLRPQAETRGREVDTTARNWMQADETDLAFCSVSSPCSAATCR